MRTKKCFRKMYVCLLAALLFPQWAAAENVQKLIIVKNDNTEVSILLSDEPKMHFSHYYHVNYSQEMCNLIITTSDGNTIELDSYNLDKMTVVSTDDVVTKVNNLMDNDASSFARQGDTFLVTVTSGNTWISVQKIDGKQILSKKLGQGQHALSLSDFPVGVYVVTINNKSIKVYKR